MAPALDHVFICCAVGAPEGDGLARVGLTEGSSNTQSGQGTANRRFFFRNAYLELLWVSDPQEAQSESVRRTRLWERWSKRGEAACPFGIVLRPGPGASDRDPPFSTWAYRPQYFPPGLAIEIAVGTPLAEPELFYMRFARRPDEIGRELTEHAIPVAEVTGLRIGLPAAGPLSPAAAALEALGLVSFFLAAPMSSSWVSTGRREERSWIFARSCCSCLDGVFFLIATPGYVLGLPAASVLLLILFRRPDESADEEIPTAGMRTRA